MADLREATREFLRRALAAKGWTAYRLAKEAGVSSTTITRPLNDDGYKFVPKIDTLSKIADAAGVDLPEVLRSNSSLAMAPVRGSIPVLGEVRAGVWSIVPDDPEPEEWLQMDVPEYAGASLFALRVAGRSMDLIYPDGTYVIVAPPAEAGVRIGDRVVVRRYDETGKAETTLKELVRNGDGIVMLQPRSSDPGQQTPLPFPMGDEQAQHGLEIIGVVVSRYANEKRGSGPLLSL